MGSFNISCFASQQTIAPGDPCWVMPVVQSASYNPVDICLPSGVVQRFGVANTTCYPNSFWNPAGPLLEATYDDYGQVRLENTQSNKFKLWSLVSYWHSKVVNVGQGENPYHENALDIHKVFELEAPTFYKLLNKVEVPAEELERRSWPECVAVFDRIWKASQQHRLFLLKSGTEPRPMQFAAIHADAAQTLVEQVGALTNWDNESLAPRELFRRAITAAKAELQKAPSGEPDQAEVFALVRKSMASHVAREELRRVGSCTGVDYEVENRALSIAVEKVLDGELSEDEAFEKAESYLHTRYVLEGLMSHNLVITPIVYAGQDYDNSIGRDYAKFIRKVSARVTKRRNRE